MTKTQSAMLPLNTPAPLFSLYDVISEQNIDLQVDARYLGTVVMFICNHCPYVKHINQALVNLAAEYSRRNIRFFAINSNDVSQYPEDAPDKMRHVALALNYPFPYLYDSTQEVAKAYHAACTPDFFIFNSALLLVYRGQFDAARPSNNLPIDGQDLRAALDAILANRAPPTPQLPSLGCNIKWKLVDA